MRSRRRNLSWVYCGGGYAAAVNVTNNAKDVADLVSRKAATNSPRAQSSLSWTRAAVSTIADSAHRHLALLDRGKVVHRYCDHASVLKFIGRNWDLGPLSDRSRDNLPNPLNDDETPTFRATCRRSAASSITTTVADPPPRPSARAPSAPAEWRLGYAGRYTRRATAAGNRSRR